VRDMEDVEPTMLGARRSIGLEYDAADCHVETLAEDDGHIPPKTYMLLCEAFVSTIVEKLKALERKSAPGRAADVTSLAVFVISCSHVPFALMLEFVGVNRHTAELVDVEQEPAYTDISPAAETVGMNAMLSSVRNGRFEVIVSRDIFDVEMVEDMLRDAS